MSYNQILSTFENSTLNEVCAYMHDSLTLIQTLELESVDEEFADLEQVLCAIGNDAQKNYHA